MTNNNNVFYSVLKQLGHLNITTDSTRLYFQFHIVPTFLYTYYWLHFSPEHQVLAASLSRLTSLQLQIQWVGKLSFFNYSENKKYCPNFHWTKPDSCPFLTITHRGQINMVLQLVSLKFHVHHLEARGNISHIQGIPERMRNGRELFPKKILLMSY